MKKSSTSNAEGGRSSARSSVLAPTDSDAPFIHTFSQVSSRPQASSADASIPQGAPSVASLFSFGSTKEKPNIHEYRPGEEIAHSVSHGVGALLAIAGMVLCIVFAMRDGGGVLLVAALVYTIPMFLEYLMSTLYHAISADGAKRVFKVLDHSFIYLYIAGSYTPFCLVTLANNGGHALCVMVWALAVAGVAVEAFWTYRPRWVAALLYLALGWCVVAFLPALVANLPTTGLVLLVAGGLCYTLGCVFYVMKKTPYMHFVFHLLVLAGSAFQFLAILLYVL